MFSVSFCCLHPGNLFRFNSIRSKLTMKIMPTRYSNVYMIFLPNSTKSFIGCSLRKEKIKIALNIIRSNKAQQKDLLLCSDNLLAERSVKNKQLMEVFVMDNLSRSSVAAINTLSLMLSGGNWFSLLLWLRQSKSCVFFV